VDSGGFLNKKTLVPFRLVVCSRTSEDKCQGKVAYDAVYILLATSHIVIYVNLFSCTSTGHIWKAFSNAAITGQKRLERKYSSLSVARY